ncbi:MAG: hypothetical protein IPM36_17105 [Lewinellaceae bacterium]|nr:hypothetical protein [Lewinellaceae bacterium]
MKRSEVESFFDSFQKNGVVLICGKMIQFYEIVEVKVGKTLIKKEEETLYRKKYHILNDDKFFSIIQDATKEFYNNEFLANLSAFSKAPKIDFLTNENLNNYRNMHFEEIETIINKIKDSIRESDVKLALQDLGEFIQKTRNKNLYKTLLLLSSQFNNEENKFNKGLSIDSVERNRIIAAIIDLADDAEQGAKKTTYN